MLDDLRQQAAESFGDDDDDAAMRTSRATRLPSRFLGLTPAQLFVVSLLLLALTCLVGTATLLVTGRVAPPIFWGSGF
jgi:hypothetical protein